MHLRTSTLAVALCFAAVATHAKAQTVQTPIQDFINAQSGTLGWTDPPHDRLFYIDFFGNSNEILMQNGFSDLGTTESGLVTQRRIPGGRQVHVEMHAENCLCNARKLSDPNVMYMGYRVFELLANPLLTPAIGSGKFSLDWTDALPAGSSSMPALNQLFFTPTPTQHLIRTTFEGTSFGPLRAAFGLPEGTPGMARTTQIALVNSPQNTIGGINGYAPTEIIEIKAVGP